MEEDEDFCPEDNAWLEDCTCEHEPEEHGWMSCEKEGCPCEGCWTY